ncbi:MAG: hypothetical protein SF182_14255 [Deltaproteobacteria bacterium]|nr:hypothetical protein [Deltaproteobacteria bacterium]
MLAAVCAAVVSGCVVVPTRTAPEPPPAPPAAPLRLAYTVGDFRFALGGGEPELSTLAGRILNDELVSAWERRGVVVETVEIDPGDPPEDAELFLTLNGTQHNDTSFWAQLLNALTLTLWPYSVTQHYDLQIELRDLPNGQYWLAQVHDVDRTYIGLFMLAALPVADRGHEETVRRMADALYRQLRAQGAFDGAAPAVPAPGSERLAGGLP